MSQSPIESLLAAYGFDKDLGTVANDSPAAFLTPPARRSAQASDGSTHSSAAAQEQESKEKALRMKDLSGPSGEPSDSTKVRLEFGGESRSDEGEKKPAGKAMPMTVNSCTSRSDPALSESKRAELEASIQAVKADQKKERKEAKEEDKATRAEKKDPEGKKPSTRQVKPKMTAKSAVSKRAAAKKKIQDEDEGSNSLDSEESPTSEELPSESDDDGCAAPTEPKDQPAKTSAKLPPKDAPAEKPKRKRVPKPVVESKDPDTKRKLAIAKAVGCVARQSEKDETKEGEVPAKKADETAVDDTQVPQTRKARKAKESKEASAKKAQAAEKARALKAAAKEKAEAKKAAKAEKADAKKAATVEKAKARKAEAAVRLQEKKADAAERLLIQTKTAEDANVEMHVTKKEDAPGHNSRQKDSTEEEIGSGAMQDKDNAEDTTQLQTPKSPEPEEEKVEETLGEESKARSKRKADDWSKVSQTRKAKTAESAAEKVHALKTEEWKAKAKEAAERLLKTQKAKATEEAKAGMHVFKEHATGHNDRQTDSTEEETGSGAMEEDTTRLQTPKSPEPEEEKVEETLGEESKAGSKRKTVEKYKGSQVKAKAEKKVKTTAQSSKRKKNAANDDKHEDSDAEVSEEDRPKVEDSTEDETPTGKNGKKPQARGKKKERKGKKVKGPEGDKEKAKPGTPGREGLRDTYWNHITEARERLRALHPEKTKTDILQMARAEWKNHPERVGSMKNMTRSELSRRRLAPKKPPSPIKEPAKPAEPAAGEAELDESHELGDELDTMFSEVEEQEELLLAELLAPSDSES